MRGDDGLTILFTRTDEDGGTKQISCTYDHMGRRATKKVTTGGSVTLHQRYLYRGYLQIACCDLKRSGHPCLWLLTWDPTQPVATRPLALRKDGTWYCYGWDLTKNICEVYKTNGGIGTAYTYSPYGEVTATGAITQPIQWFSEYADTELGLTYYNYRHYNSLCGFWICREALGENESHHLYCFLYNKPFYIDVLGWKKWEEGPSGDKYRSDPWGHGKNPDGTPKDPHVDRQPKSGGTHYRYDLDGTPRAKAPKIPKKDIPLFKKIVKKCMRFCSKKIPYVGWGLTIEGIYDGYQENGFWGAVEGAIW